MFKLDPKNLKIDIRPYDAKDCDGLFKIATAKIFTWLPYGPFKNVPEMQAFYQKKSKDCEFFTVYDRESNIIHGILAIKYIVPEHKKCEIGHIWYGYRRYSFCKHIHDNCKCTRRHYRRVP